MLERRTRTAINKATQLGGWLMKRGDECAKPEPRPKTEIHLRLGVRISGVAWQRKGPSPATFLMGEGELRRVALHQASVTFAARGFRRRLTLALATEAGRRLGAMWLIRTASSERHLDGKAPPTVVTRGGNFDAAVTNASHTHTQAHTHTHTYARACRKYKDKDGGVRGGGTSAAEALPPRPRRHLDGKALLPPPTAAPRRQGYPPSPLYRHLSPTRGRQLEHFILIFEKRRPGRAKRTLNRTERPAFYWAVGRGTGLDQVQRAQPRVPQQEPHFTRRK